MGWSYLRVGLWTLLGLLPSIAGAGFQGYPIQIVARPLAGGVELVARNDGWVPVSVQINLRGDNLSVSPPLLRVPVIPGRSETRLSLLRPQDARHSWHYSYDFSYQIGDYRAYHSPAERYRLPYPDGVAARVGQAPGGVLTSHDAPDSREAIDFNLPEGTPVVAARNGQVVDIVLAYHAAGGRELADRANSVTVLQGDGTLAEYVHLAPRPSPVRLGQWVSAGEVVGYSGNTGWSTGPHLHFVVHATVLSEDGRLSWRSQALRFVNGQSGVPIGVQQGEWIRAEPGPGIPPSRPPR